jgi:serine phosphatase RsbU (regulator of sigma subunit)
MAKSDSATAFADLTPNGLEAYRHLYEGTCERKWSEVSEAGRQVRCMGRFLKDTKHWEDYQRWAPGETDARQKEYEQEQAQKRAARAAAKAQEKEQQQEAQLAKIEQQNQQLQSQNQQMQQSLAAAQQQMATQAAQTNAAASSGDDDWLGLNYYGAVSNLQRAGWARDAAYAGAARNGTATRVASWHGAGGAGGGRR